MPRPFAQCGLRILEFEKTIADELLEYLTNSIISSIVEKVDINDYSKTKESAVFIISKELENLDDKFIESLSQAKTKHDIDTKKRIEVKGKFEDRLSTVINYKPLKEEMMTSLIGFEEAIRNNEIRDGFVMLDEKTNLIKVNGYWFKIKIPDNFRELLSSVIGEDLFMEIEKLYQFYINSIPNITTFDEGLKISKPIQIIMQNDQNRDSSI